MSPAPRLSVVLGSFNRLEPLKRCLDSIQAQTETPTITYITDAGSTDGTQEYLKSVASERIVPILVGRKLGQAKAYNDVFAEVSTPYVAWLSDDNEVVERGLDAAVRILDRHRRIGMLALKVKDVQGPFVSAPYIGGISEIGVLNVNQGMLRTEVLKSVGGFSELFASYGIDPDLTAKVLFAGHDIAYTRQVVLHHYRDWALDPTTEAGAALKAQHVRSLDLYRRKYGHLSEADGWWRFKKRVWKRIEQKLGAKLYMDSGEAWAGGIPRDWFNAFNARYISPFDPWLSIGREHHLVQRGHKPGCPPLSDDAISPG